MIKYAACFVAGAIVMQSVGAAPLLGPKGKFEAGFLYDLKYDPSRGCSKPSRPFSDDEFSWQMYRTDGARYLDCLKAASVADIDYASEVIGDGYSKAVKDFLAEVKLGY